MAEKKQSKGTGSMVAGGGVAAYGVANAPVLRQGSKDMTQMVGASPKKQGARYQAELHQAMKSGKVETDSPVHVLRTPSGRHINAGGTHRKIARDAMGKPSQYEVKNLPSEVHVSPIQRVQSKVRLAGLKRGSKMAEAGKNVKPVGSIARSANSALAGAADVADAHVWRNPSALTEGIKAGRRVGMKNAAGLVGTGAIVAAAGHHQRAEWKKTHPVSKRQQKPLMSEAEQRRRQKLQGKIGRTTSALGLTGVGLATAGAVAAKKPGALKQIQRLPKMKNATHQGLKDAAFYTGIASGGIGGVGGFNQASIYSAEARRRNQTVKKDYGMDMGYFGEEAHAITHEEIEKAWEPTSRQYDPEAKRHKRAKNYETGLTAASSGTGAGAATAGAVAWHGHGKNQRAGRAIADKLGMRSTQIVPEAGRLKAIKRGKVAAGLAGASVATGVGAALVNHQRKGSWKSYSKRDTQSAFGVDHEPNGQHRETEN